MEWNDIVVDGQHIVKFTDLPYVPLTSPPQSVEDDELFYGRKQGGILRHGEWAWLARNSVLQIVSLRSGQTISSYEFCDSRGYKSCCIKSVEEIFPNNPEIMLLAVVLESFCGPGGGCSYIAVFSVELTSVLSCIELSLHLTCARFMDAFACRRSLLQNFDGCLAVGSEEGVVVLLDLNIRKLTLMQNELHEDIFVTCHIVDYSLPLAEIHRNFRQCQQDGTHFGLQMEVIESPCSIQSILPIDLILGLAIGLEDGRLALYDLYELQIFYVALPNPEVTMSSIVKMDFLEPPDDPRPCLFIWAIHENDENLHAVLHDLMYEKRVLGDDESSTYFETFQASSVRLQLPLEATKSVALACQAVSTLSTHGEDDSNCLCAISWLSVLEGKNKLLIFDLNQWYKEEMPYVLEYGKQPNYLAGYILNGECTGLHTLLNPDSIAHFNSMQRFEEHFYPNSLSFESLLLHTEGCRRYNWEGAQNRVINLLRSSNAAIFLEPNLYFNEIIRTRLMPQFIELNINSTFSRDAKYEILLSAALENNCVSLLRDCAKSWIDGSCMGNFSASTGLSLSTLTDWIWKRATCIKSRCNDLCKSLFEFGGYPLDNREQKELAFITRQLKLLTDLLNEILIYAKKQIPERVQINLKSKQNSLSMASSYQEILLWLLNIGLLPEASPYNDKISASNNFIPYPHKELNEFYRNKRLFFAKINETFISKKSGSCKLLFIDAFIEHVCKGNVLHEYWLENEGNGLYPPNSLEAMLRVMLIPDLNYENKCAILLYFFLDLNMAIDEEVYKDVVPNFIKFPSVFKLSAPLIKTVQAFWNLDHDHYLPAVDEFISPFNKNQCYPQWQVELVIEVLLNQKANNLALRILESQPSLISPLLKLNTLLANELISEAFHFVRSKNDDTLLETFFTCCLRNGRFGVIRDLALSEREGLILQNILKRSNSAGAESLHFVYLLQKSKYLEAVSYMDELSNKAKGIRAYQMDTPNLVLSAFNTTMAPVTQGLTDVYFRIKNKIKKKEVDNKSPVPLSCQLIKQNANGLLGGIYHSSALSAHFATYYWGEMEEQTQQTRHLLNASNAPFLRSPQIGTNSIDYMPKNTISYPQAYKVIEKRTLLESGLVDDEDDKFERQKMEHKLNPKKKRRLIGEEILENLSQCMKMNKTSNSLNASEFAFGPEKTSETEPARKNSLDLMTRPLITKPQKELDGVAISVPEIHGILKTHTPDLSQLQRDPLVEEEKNLRFKLPAADVSSAEITQKEDAIEDMKIAQEGKTEEGIRQSTLLTNSPKFKQISRAVSKESNKSSASSSITSEVNFYSPSSSKNNSILDCSNLSRYSFLSGPKPRKPLARFSAERSEKSLTPESPPKPTDSNSVTKSRSLHYATTPESILKTKISPISSMERPNATEGFSDKERSDEAYITAHESALASKVHPRKSLERFNSDSMKKTVTTDDIGSCSEIYVTATETFSKPLSFFSSNLKKEVAQTTSGFGSMGSNATFARSKIDEFSPQVSSSKVGTTSIYNMEENKPPSAVKLSECSTVLSSLTTFECTNTEDNTVLAVSSMPEDKNKSDLDKPTDEQKCQMLETTLGMSTFDFSILDSTSMQQTKSSLMGTTKDITCTLKLAKTNENKVMGLVEEEKLEMDYEEHLEENKVDPEHKMDDGIEIRKESNSPDHTEESNYDCIVLSSSSSSLRSSKEQEDDYEHNYEDNYSDYERDIEDEIDNEGDKIEEDENFDFGDSHESNISNEDLEDDDDEVDHNMEMSMDNYNDTDNEDFIQLIEDSSSDIRQQQDNYYDESDSDDVKLIEDEQPPLAAENIKLPVSEVEAANKDISSNIPNVEKTDVKEAKLGNEGDVEIIANTSDKSSSACENMFEKNDSNLAEDSKQLPLTENNPLEIDIRIGENVSPSKTEIITESESIDLHQKDILDITISSDQDQPHAVVTSEKTEVKTSENKNPESSNSKKITEIIEIVELTEEELINLRVENPIDISESKINKQFDIKTTIEEKTSTVQGKSESIMEIETEEIEKKTGTVKGKLEAIHQIESEEIEKKTDTVEETSEAIIETESEKIERKSDTVEKKSEAIIQIESKSKEKKTETIEEKFVTLTETKSEEIEGKAGTVVKTEPIIEIESKEIEKKTGTVEEKSASSMQRENEEMEKQSETIEEKSQATVEIGSEEVEKKADAVEEKTNTFIEIDSEEIAKKSGTVEKQSDPIIEVGNAAEEKSELSIEKGKIIKKSEQKEKPKVQEFESDITPTTSQRKRKTSRGSSVPPVEIDVNAVATLSTPRRNTRGISVPPQTISQNEEFSNLTPRTRRNVRASSLQPKYKIEEIETGTPRKVQKTQDSECSETKSTRGSSLPPGTIDDKIKTRRRSVLLDAINEDSVTLDSPSTRTRLKSRLNSMDSEVDSPMVGATDNLLQQKRARKTSIAELTLTPKRIRRDSITSQPETSATVTTSRALKARSTLSVQEEDTESILASPKPSSNKSIDMKRKKSISEEPATESNEPAEQIFPKTDQSTVSEVSYASSRRLTRTQLAIMEKSVALSQPSTKYAVAKETIFPPSNKRLTKARSTRSTRSSNANADSDDAESVSSKLSTASSVTGTKRRVTRSSIKAKDDGDDDGVSVASSFGSEKHQRTRRSKDKSSPITTLTTIPEDRSVETKKRGRSAKQ